MSSPIYNLFGNNATAYHKDSSDNEYFGWAAIGTATSSAGWKICKQTYTGDNWVITWADSNANNDNKWDDVESLTYG